MIWQEPYKWIKTYTMTPEDRKNARYYVRIKYRSIMSPEAKDRWFAPFSMRDREIADQRFGLSDDYSTPLTLRAIGDLHGIGPERVRQIESRLLRVFAQTWLIPPS